MLFVRSLQYQLYLHVSDLESMHTVSRVLMRGISSMRNTSGIERSKGGSRLCLVVIAAMIVYALIYSGHREMCYLVGAWDVLHQSEV